MKKERAELVQEIAEKFPNTTVYENSIYEDDGDLFFMAKRGTESLLMILLSAPDSADGFTGEEVSSGNRTYRLCKLTKNNAAALRDRFAFTNPVLIGKEASFGFGDRLGNAGPAHLRAARETTFKPILAQQSIRELERTRREPHEVMDAASWAVFREGYRHGFGADADHLKTTEDIDIMVSAGFTMFTIDPGEYVTDGVDELQTTVLEGLYKKLPWDELEDKPEALLKRYSDQDIVLHSTDLSPDRREVLEGMVKYGNVITHTKKMVRYLKTNFPDRPAEIELSVDETNQPTTPFEHYLIASELERLGIDLVSLAPRFCGKFEKGVDFRGDLEQFRREYQLHLAIAEKFGGYKLSLHSGSDKFSVYEVMGSFDNRAVHIKTAGTSYLEALRVVAQTDPELFRQILKFSASRFQEDNRTYHVSARVPEPHEMTGWTDQELPELLNDDDIRQVLHVAYGSVLSGDQPEAAPFKNQIMEILESNEQLYEETLISHFRKHLNPFK